MIKTRKVVDVVEVVEVVEVAEMVEAVADLRPLSPRSIVLSVLLGSHPPSMPVASLLAFTELFGLSAGSVRTALSRMVAAGELEAVDGSYRLGGRLLARQAEQDAGRRGPPVAWDGTWWFVAVLPDRRAVTQRRAFRTSATGARLGELRPDTWLRPANIDVPLDLPDTAITRGRLVAGDDTALVRRLWDVDTLDRLAGEHVGRLRSAERALAHPSNVTDDGLVDAFVTLAAAQRFLRSEPQLPDLLAPSPAATELRSQYGAVVATFQERLTDFLRRSGRRSDQ